MATPVAESLKRFRRQFNLKQKEVADALGISQQAYQVYERDSYPSAKIILRLADAYDVSTDYLLGRSDEPRPQKYDDEEIAQALALRAIFREEIQRAVVACDRGQDNLRQIG